MIIREINLGFVLCETQKKRADLLPARPACSVVLYVCGVDVGDVVCDYLIVGMPRCVIRDVMDDRCCGNVKWGEVNRDDGRVYERRFCRGGLKREQYNVVIGNRGW
jgi:hypothetical protein